MAPLDSETKRVKAHKLIGVTSHVGFNVLLAVLVAASLSVFSPIPFGISSYAVATSSMEPSIPKGSLVYVNNRVASDSLPEGSVIAFDIDGITMTHRVVECDAQVGAYRTKGDANADIDAHTVAFEDVVGEVVGVVPLLGNALQAFSANAVPCMLFCAGILIGLYTLSLSFGKKKKGSEDGEN